MASMRPLVLLLLVCLVAVPFPGAAVAGQAGPAAPAGGLALPTAHPATREPWASPGGRSGPAARPIPRAVSGESVPAPADAVLPDGVSPAWWDTVRAGLSADAGRTRRAPHITLGGLFTGEGGGDEYGLAVAAAGDVNGDGYADALVGAPGYMSATGQVYLYLGSPAGLSSVPAWSAVGETAGDRFGSALAGGGDVDGDGYVDVVIGAPGYSSATGRAYLYLGSPAGLSLSPAWTATGEATGAYFGAAVAVAGDVDDSTYADLLIGSPGYMNALGKAYLYLGAPAGPSLTPDWTATGEAAGDRFAVAVAAAGDVDGDLYADILIGAPDYATSQGKAYLYRGSPSGPPPVPDWSDVGEGGHFGRSLAAAGDVDEDGYADIVVAAWDDALPSAGYVYLYRGTVEGPSLLPDWIAYGRGPDSRFGYTVAAAGDVNADGYGDLIIGDGEAQAWLYLGSVEGLPEFADWTALGDSPAAPPDSAAAGVGDVDGDGYGDLLVGSSGYDDGRGRAWWYRGAAAVLSLAWSASGENQWDALGIVATAGDVNGDGYSDVLVGAPGYGGFQGQAYLYLGSPEGPAASPVWSAAGENTSDRFAAVLAGAGDVNGDGYADILVGAWGYSGNQGKAYLYLGSPGGPSPFPDWTATGQWPEDGFGTALAGAGDVDGDGYGDILVGAPYAGGLRGRAYLYRGSPAGPSSTPDWTATGEGTFDGFGFAVAGAGHTDGDGYADILVGAPWFNSGYGRAYLYRGSAAGPSSTPDWTATGDISGLGFAQALAGAGDIDGDGYADILVGVPYSNQDAGQTYLYRGSPTGPSPSPDWTFSGRQGENLGGALAPAGDVNGDGYGDFLMGGIFVLELPKDGPSAPEGLTYGQGRAYLYLGDPLSPFAPDWTATGVPGEFLGGSLATAGDVDGDGYADILVGGVGHLAYTGRVLLFRGGPSVSALESGWTATSENSGDYFGFAVASAGDVNGDGYTDALVGAPFYDSNRGKAYLYLGSPAGLSLSPAWTATGESVGDGFAYALAGAGDVNGDGYADILIGAWGYDNVRGKAYLYMGSVEGPAFSPDWTATGENQGDDFGTALAGAGDVNGDGYADLLVGADCYGGDLGRAYLYQGSPAGPSLTADWVATGETSGDYLGTPVASAGDVNGDGYSDVLVTAYGHFSDTGRAYLYLGSLDGLAPAPAWSALGEAPGDMFGWPVASIGDVNGDGYSDIAAGAGYHDNSRGKVYLYLGSAAGPAPTPDWTALGEVEGDEFGYMISSAGDTNGDGYADLLVGAPFYGDGNYGRAYLYAGSAAGLAAIPSWSVTGAGWAGFLGHAVAAAGDVDGDGYADILAAAPFNPGQVLLYYGNGGHGATFSPGQWRTDGSAPIAPLGLSDSPTAVQLRLGGRSPAGRDRVKWQWQIAPLGTPFTATGAISGTSPQWTDTLTTGVTLSETVGGLTQGTPYHWRVRLLYHPNGGLGRPAGPWMSMPLGGRQEKAMRTADGPIGTLAAQGDPLIPLGQTTHLTATVDPPSLYLRYAWSFGDGEVGRGAIVTHTYAAAGLYAAVVTASNSVDLVTATVDVLVEEPPAGLAATCSAPTALGQPTLFTATVTAGISVTYEWDFGDGIAAGRIPEGWALGAASVVSHTYAAAGRYTATVTASTALGSVQATTAVVIEEPVSNLAAANDGPTALGWPTTLWAEAAGTSVSYAWDLGDGTVADGAQVTHAYTAAGTYLAVVTASNDVSMLTATTTVLVVAGEIPIAGLTATSNSPTIVGYTTQLRAQVTAGTSVSYTWSLGDGATAGGDRVAHVYPGPGIYAAVVTASNSVSQMTATTVVSVAVAVPLDPRWGGVLTFSDTQGLTTTVEAPPGAVTQTTLMAYIPLLTPTQPLTPGLSFCRHAFHLDVFPRFYIYVPICWRGPAGQGQAAPDPAALVWGTAPPLAGPQPAGFAFLKPVTITICYSDEDVAGVDESTLRLVYWTGTGWADAAGTCAPPSAYVRDLEKNVLSVAVCHLTEFELVGQ